MKTGEQSISRNVVSIKYLSESVQHNIGTVSVLQMAYQLIHDLRKKREGKISERERDPYLIRRLLNGIVSAWVMWRQASQWSGQDSNRTPAKYRSETAALNQSVL
jgi:hypothetical protein